jgi:tellurite resistance protein TerC
MSLTIVAFVVFVLIVSAIDLFTDRRRHGEMRMSIALMWSGAWITLAGAFGLFVWKTRGLDAAVNYYTGYLLEESLSADNLFVFMLIFSHYRVPKEEQHRVLTWGIVGALILRATIIVTGAQLIERSHIVVYLFGAVLLYTGFRAFWSPPSAEDREDTADRWTIRIIRKVIPIDPHYHGGAFFAFVEGHWRGTLLLLVLIVVEVSDVVFAVDSIPAVFAITHDPFIVFTSNIMAILGLRALFFALVELLSRVQYLRYGLGTILVLIGVKMCASSFWTVPPLYSLASTIGILAITVFISLVKNRQRPIESGKKGD